MVRQVTDDEVGLKTLYQPSEEDGNTNMTVDIVAVHGLGAHPDETWSTNRGTEGEPVWVNWLEEADMLPAGVPTTRIMRYGYKSGWFGPGKVKHTARTVAQTLLFALRRERKKCPTRPLIFIGHSFGGLVVLKAVCEAYEEKAEWPELFDSVLGMVFLGTPFRGADGMSQSEMLQAAAREYDEEDIEKEPLQILDPGNEILQELVDRFCRIWSRSHRAPVACFFELQASEVGKIVGKQRRKAFVVNERSGCLDPSDHVKKYPLAKNHFTINKFGRPTEESFLIVRDVVKEMVMHAQGRRPSALSAQTDDVEQSTTVHYQVSTTESTYDLVCRRRVKNFTGRSIQLQEMRSYFSKQETSEPRILILQALGGQGKSQIALEYCRQCQYIYGGIFWVNASSETMAIQSFERLAAELDPTLSNVPRDVNMKIRWVKDALRQRMDRWLLLFDNYDDPTGFPQVERFIPSRGRGDILVTSRNKSLDRLGLVLEVPPMPTKDGVTLLLLGYPHINVDDHMQEGTAIVDRLGGLALAIDQAAAYIKYKKLPIEQLAQFLPLYEAQCEKILQYTPANFWKYSMLQIHGKEEQDRAINAFTTWEMSFQQLRSNNPRQREDASHFLTLSAFFNPVNIDESIFRRHWELQLNASQPKWMNIFVAMDKVSPYGESGVIETNPGDEEAIHVDAHAQTRSVWDTERFWSLLDEAHELSLLGSISSETGEREVNFSLHPLIRDWLQLREKPQERRQYTRDAIDFVVSSIRTYESNSTNLYQKELLMAHMDTCLLNDARFSVGGHHLGEDIKTHTEAAWFASFYRNQGRYKTWEKLERLCLKTRQKELGSEHPDTLTSMNNVAMVLGSQGKHKQAEEIHREVLRLMETSLGKEHPSTLTSMSNLTTVLRNQGRHKQAEDIDLHILRLRETTLGNEHPLTRATLTSLAVELRHQGKCRQAEEIYRQLLRLSKVIPGKEDRPTLTIMNNLAIVLSSQGKYKQAEEIHQQVLGLSKAVMGEKHPETLASMNNLAETLSGYGKYKQAEEIHQQALGLRETVLGKEHPDTLESMNNLADVLSRQLEYVKAEQMLQKVLGLSESVLGKEHLITLTSMQNLATVLNSQGRYEEAEAMHRQELGLCETVLGKENPSTLMSMHNLAAVLSNQGRYKEAEEIQQQVLGLRETVLGKEHPDTMLSMNNLANTLNGQGKCNQAEEMHRLALRLRSKILGEEHLSTLMSMTNLATTLWNQGYFQEAVKLEVQVLNTRTRTLGLEHPDTCTSMINLAYIWQSLGQVVVSIQLLKRAARIQSEMLGPEHPDVINSMQILHEWMATTENVEVTSLITSEQAPVLPASCQICDSSDQVD